MARMTDEQIIAEKEAKFAGMTDEERAQAYRHEYNEDRRMCAALSEELKATIEPIRGDIHHILVNGRVMGYNGFAEWKKQRQHDLAHGRVTSGKLGFFNS